jgi:hypothetical protein
MKTEGRSLTLPDPLGHNKFDTLLARVDTFEAGTRFFSPLIPQAHSETNDVRLVSRMKL